MRTGQGWYRRWQRPLPGRVEAVMPKEVFWEQQATRKHLFIALLWELGMADVGRGAQGVWLDGRRLRRRSTGWREGEGAWPSGV